jgi:uncharacterized protein YwqG
MKKTIAVIGIITIILFVIFKEKDAAMGIFDRIFGKKESSVKTGAMKDFSEHRQYIDALRKPAIRIEKADMPAFSKIGGLPLADVSFQWPVWNDKPLAFLCQIDLEAIPKSESTRDLPGEGLLYFFYDQEQRTWGFDPKDRGSWKVMFVQGKTGLRPVDAPAGLKKEHIYKEKYIQFAEILTYPDLMDDRINKLNLNDAQADGYAELCSSVFVSQPSHYLLGYPSPVQGNDMDLESQLAANGLYLGDANGYNSSKAKELESGRYDWMLLLQFDSDDDAGIMWGDAGMLYFWIRKVDLAKRDFNDVWMILQCY